jgi:hypothetical protein
MYLTYCCLHLTQLPDELHVIQPPKEYFVGHSDEHMEERIHAVSEAKKTVISLVKEKSWDNQDENYDSSPSSDSPFDNYPASFHGGLCIMP